MMPTKDTTCTSLLWTPNNPTFTNIYRFHQLLVKKGYLSPSDISTPTGYEHFHRWSCDNMQIFYKEFLSFSHIDLIGDILPVVEDKLMDQLPRWFPNTTVSYTEHCLRERSDRIAVYCLQENSDDLKSISFSQLYKLVAQTTQALRAENVSIGDRVAAYAPNCLEVLVLYLACASVGAIFTTASPDFGVTATVDRFAQIEPVLLLTSNFAWYNGKKHDLITKAIEVASKVPSIRKMIVIGDDSKTNFDEWIAPHSCAELQADQVAFSHPLIILYSSGTTGKPKCIVHSTGGTLIQHYKEHLLHGDMTDRDIYLQYTTIGWMMWPWMVSALFTGASIVLYDGSPLWPDTLRLFKIVDQLQVTVLGVSAKYLQTLQENMTKEIDKMEISKYNLSSLRAVLSTASPLGADTMQWVYSHVKNDLMLASITGGTDIIGLFAGGCPVLPVHAGEIQCKCLGMDIAIANTDVISNDSPKNVDTETCITGDLICKRPFPSMPVYFWKDDNNLLYKKAYFTECPGVWHHSDWVQFNPMTGGLKMLGRSDSTLNPAGVRFGSAEIYNALQPLILEGLIQDSLVVGMRRPCDTDERVVLFVQLPQMSDCVVDDALANRIKQCIRSALSPRHVPSLILACPSIPYTPNGKKVEVAVKKILSNNIPCTDPQLSYFSQLNINQYI